MTTQAVEEYQGVTIFFESVVRITDGGVPLRFRGTLSDRTYSAATIGELKAKIDIALAVRNAPNASGRH
ncbi:MAG TPA: hypothetical protein VGN12_02330 [Pirellulales bacterium]|jgi:hypothetical protein